MDRRTARGVLKEREKGWKTWFGEGAERGEEGVKGCSGGELFLIDLRTADSATNSMHDHVPQTQSSSSTSEPTSKQPSALSRGPPNPSAPISCSRANHTL